MTSTAEILERAAVKPEKRDTREQLEMNIKVAQNWMTAVKAGTYRGHESIHIAGLLNFLEAQHNLALKEYQERFPGQEVKQ